MMYCGSYAKKPDGSADDFIYVGYNFHNGISQLALPKLAEKKKWYLVMDTALMEEAFLPKVKLLENQQLLTMKAQSVMVLIGK